LPYDFAGTKTDYAREVIARYTKEAGRALKPNGRIFLNSDLSNRYGHANLLRLQEAEQLLDKLGLVAEKPVSLLARFSGQDNRHTLSGEPVKSTIFTTVLRKARKE